MESCLSRNTVLVFACICVIPVCSNAQYRGGTYQGFDQIRAEQLQNTLPAMTFGGPQDGTDVVFILSQNSAPEIYFGAIEDGFSGRSSLQQNELPHIFYGNELDGFSFVNVNDANVLPGIYTGGVSDGIHLAQSTMVNQLPGIYGGGSEDGFDAEQQLNQNSPCSGHHFVWTGRINNQWHEPGNWECHLLPGLYSRVLIPEGLSANGYFYPTAFENAEISVITLRPGAYLQIEPGVVFKLNGD